MLLAMDAIKSEFVIWSKVRREDSYRKIPAPVAQPAEAHKSEPGLGIFFWVAYILE